ncbi:hypothetical protein [Natronobacterium gregoryi]|uniref:Uncharacterized protein n=2 Tax=Natronobacterium gregoryi TaxID=44930 RepID=L0ANB1_NATGS|nr:hypothetical protein [Natronobacterium gregoryi]AFZ74565.1 hypothetical protein Natgr_3446 [Natronobacterium gregoryi SP2]ELY72365.1 hypothetical protein C490_03438 [Natronobacterium gregoryi SP2]PLK21693.1 hypothetical protein CYV19_02330 [Natronobacterium gregoryi SP2]SFI96120.1 hypothetical protein SAMN05443661_110140 [Natronobacterium gregoryi]
MPRQTEHFAFEEELEQIREQKEEITDSMMQISQENPAWDDLIRTGNSLDTYENAIQWADEAHEDDSQPEWNDDVDGVTIAGLSGGEEAEAIDRLRSADGGEKARRNYYVAAGTVDAPYCDVLDDWSSASIDERVAVVSQLPPDYLEWADAKVDELTSVGEGKGNSFWRLYAEKRRQQTAK